MVQMAQAQVQDTIEGSSLIEIRSALQHIHREPDIRSYAVRVLRNGSTLIVFLPKDDESQAIVVQGGTALAAGEGKTRLAGSKQTGILHRGSLAVILAAVPTFEQRKLNLADYRVTVLQDENSYLVTFVDKDSQPGGRGNPGKRLGFEVQVNNSDLQVMNSHFIR